ncbi:MAG: hypothetical protein GF334_00880 [Candidatus Altiarchaeales archaeon]|nr:hypothetical protein [Candidatus Altiarchaeales archaeon]
MDRIALSKRLEGFSQVFADGTPMARDLKAMSYVLANMSDEKFANVVNANWGADMSEEDKEAFVRGMQPGYQPRGPQQMMQQRRQRQERLEGMPETPVFEPRDPKAALQALMANPAVQKAVQSDPKLKGLINQDQPKMATKDSEEAESSEVGGGYWNREASSAVMAALVEDVIGKEAMEKSVCCDTKMHLDKEQTPDGEHKQETPSTLKPEQTPHIDESLDSDIVDESKKTSVKKEAAKKDSGLEELKEDKAEKAKEKAEKLEDEAKEDAGEAKKKLDKAEEVEEKAEDLEVKDDKDDDEDEMPVESKSKKKKATKEEEPVLASEGVELVPPMQEIELSDDEAAKLGALFSE